MCERVSDLPPCRPQAPLHPIPKPRDLRREELLRNLAPQWLVQDVPEVHGPRGSGTAPSGAPVGRLSTWHAPAARSVRTQAWECELLDTSIPLGIEKSKPPRHAGGLANHFVSITLWPIRWLPGITLGCFGQEPRTGASSVCFTAVPGPTAWTAGGERSRLIRLLVGG